MKVAKEGWVVIAVIGFISAWLLDKLAGPINLDITNPIAFLQSPLLLSRFPLTLTAIIVRSAALFISVMLVFSLIEKKYFTKILVLIVMLILGEFYAIQQLATGFQLTSVQWTLSIAYGSVLLLLGVVGMLLMGIWSAFNTPKKSFNPESKED